MTLPDPNPTPTPPEPSGSRRWPTSTFGGLMFLAVVAFTCVGFAVVAFGPWRRGIAFVGIACLFASGMRLVIKEQEAGMLRVRGRSFDVVALAGVGVALIALATNIPDQPGL